jgi:hypothetical protein
MSGSSGEQNSATVDNKSTSKPLTIDDLSLFRHPHITPEELSIIYPYPYPPSVSGFTNSEINESPLLFDIRGAECVLVLGSSDGPKCGTHGKGNLVCEHGYLKCDVALMKLKEQKRKQAFEEEKKRVNYPDNDFINYGYNARRTRHTPFEFYRNPEAEIYSELWKCVRKPLALVGKAMYNHLAQCANTKSETDKQQTNSHTTTNNSVSDHKNSSNSSTECFREDAEVQNVLEKVECSNDDGNVS